MKVDFIGFIKDDAIVESDGNKKRMKFDVECSKAGRSKRLTCYRSNPTEELLQTYKGGTRIYVRGHLSVRSYNTDDGRAHYNLSCRLIDADILS